MEMSSTSSAPSPCAKGCGFFGSPGTLNLCSACFTKHLLTTAPAAVASKEAVVEKEAAAAAPPAALTLAEIQQKAWRKRLAEAAKEKYFENRCTCCMKKFGIGGRFQCRCGKAYCIKHMHSEMHGCTFDYERAGRISIRRNNPLIEGEKLRDRI